MPLFLQALPLSLKTFWRYLAILPILGVVAILMLLASLIPVIGYFVPGTVAAYCLMTGLLCALAARGHPVDADFGQMVRAGLVFCVMNIVAAFVLNYVAEILVVAIVLALRGLGLGAEGGSALWYLLGGKGTIYPLLLLLWSAALAVPMTFAVAASGRRGSGIYPFEGIGKGMISLSLISIVWMIGGSLFSIFGEVATILALLFETIRAVIASEDPAWDWSISPFSLLGGTLWMTWASSWFFSTAVLYWERAVDRRKTAALARVEALRVSSQDLRALRLARQQQNEGPSG